MKKTELKIIATCGEDEIQRIPMFDISNVDILEVRLDLLSKEFLEKKARGYLEIWRKPIIFTNRNPIDSNQKKYYKHKKKSLELFLSFYNSPLHLIDLEMDRKKPGLIDFKNQRFRIIYSYHNFESSISMKKMQKYIDKTKKEEAIFKFAVKPSNYKELAQFLEDINELSHLYSIIGIPMGDIGSIARIYPEKFGSSYTYACLGKPRAPGQINAETIYRIRKIGS